jgi:predicted fused transcriptional regulator/phosphomethylpyrimidine kinase
MKQIISKDGQVKCVTTVPYPPEIIKQMKAEGYKITTIKDDKEG